MAHLRDAPDVLSPVLFREAEVAVEAEADVVAVETVGRESEAEQPPLEGGPNGGLARGREPGEPYGQAALASELAALATGE